MRSNRLRRYYLGERFVLDMLNPMARWPEFIVLPVVRGVPDGAQLHAIHHCPERRGFMVLVSHPSFDEVRDGEECPYDGDVLGVENVVLARQTDGSYRVPGVTAFDAACCCCHCIEPSSIKVTWDENPQSAAGDVVEAARRLMIPREVIEPEAKPNSEADAQRDFFKAAILAE